MIEKMKVLHVVTDAPHKENLLSELRNLGIMHFAETNDADAALTSRFELLSKTATALTEYVQKDASGKVLSDEEFEELFQKSVDALDQKKILLSEQSKAMSAMDKISSWGDFNPSDVEELAKHGFDFHFYTLDKKNFALLCEDKNIKFIHLSDVDKMNTAAVLGVLPAEYSATEFVMPERGLTELRQTADECEAKIKDYDSYLTEAASYINNFNIQMLKTQNEAEYSAVGNTAGTESGLIWLSGYIPESEVDGFKVKASENSWAYALDDPDEEDEAVPTKVKYNKLTRLMTPVFDILGIVPGYKEYDISFWFLGFFILFFAMIIGDAGYGFIFLIAAIALHAKTKKLSDAVSLLYVLSIGTIIWGGLTGTWFGFEGAMRIPILKALVIPSFANYPEYFGVTATQQQNAIMKFCFIIGTVQLSLACIMNVRRKLKEKDLSLVADIGWLLAIDALYFLVLFLVFGSDINMVPVGIIVGIGFVLVVLFGAMAPGKSFAEGVKAGLADAFTTFLNTISAFGNVMSYIRLFAVGMASLAIAQSFNNMALGFSGPLIVVGVIIMLLGHALNLVMGLLSVVVHGVRLNLLEFSGQLGMEWSGIAYNPFKKFDKIKK